MNLGDKVLSGLFKYLDVFFNIDQTDNKSSTRISHINSYISMSIV